ncbi:hypothetical protein HU200_016345 [Digitaria exilis]|uniref:F-box domain-containing protein n=1 Tax=Digitaria exilis TaxID=1010633 RepID=A0A835KIC8_9POAL|nr:hypothetical protein HU200_016345 [Digitaria exilis]
MAAPPPPPPTELIGDVIAEILLRLPPDEPEYLFRAALVCKPWLRVLCDPGFRRRYRAFHGAPPLLGLLHSLQVLQGSPPDRFASSTSMPDFPRPSSHGPHARPHPDVGSRAAVIGDETSCTLRDSRAIIKYDGAKDCLSMINPPPHNAYGVSLMVMDNSSLGFVFIEGSSLHVWSRKVNSEAPAEWVQCQIIELEKIIPVVDPCEAPFVVGSAEGVGSIFISTDAGLFTIELKSGRVRKVDDHGVYFSVLPYMNFCTPDRGRLLSLARAEGC